MKRWLLGLVALSFVVSSHVSVADAATVRGRVTLPGGVYPVSGALVRLDLEPADGAFEHEVETDVLGAYLIEGVADGATFLATASHPWYLPDDETLVVDEDEVRRDFVLTIDEDGPDPLSFFSIDFDVHCAVAQSTLPDTDITIERFASDDTSGGPIDSVILTTGAYGRASWGGLEEGFYRFTYDRSGWDSFTYPAMGATFIDTDQVAYVGLDPIGTTFEVDVEGINPANPTAEGNVQYGALENVFVEITGLDITTLEPTMPVITDITDSDGNVRFRALPAIPYQVDIFRMGYLTQTLTVFPAADETLPTQEVDLQLNFDTGIELEFDWIYEQDLGFFAIEAFAEGIPGSGADGVYRRWSWSPEPGVMRFDEILPGRYRVTVRATRGIRVTGEFNGFFESVPSTIGGNGEFFDVLIEPIELVVEVPDASTATREVFAEVVPTEIMGVLRADEEPNTSGFPFFQNRSMVPLAGGRARVRSPRRPRELARGGGRRPGNDGGRRHLRGEPDPGRVWDPCPRGDRLHGGQRRDSLLGDPYRQRRAQQPGDRLARRDAVDDAR